jgi:hypothetical protein
MLVEAATAGWPVVPAAILDEVMEGLGAAAK